jgi:hypothetical protein
VEEGVVVGFEVGLVVDVVVVEVVVTKILMCDLELHITLTPMFLRNDHRWMIWLSIYTFKACDEVTPGNALCYKPIIWLAFVVVTPCTCIGTPGAVLSLDLNTKNSLQASLDSTQTRNAIVYFITMRFM